MGCSCRRDSLSELLWVDRNSSVVYCCVIFRSRDGGGLILISPTWLENIYTGWQG